MALIKHTKIITDEGYHEAELRLISISRAQFRGSWCIEQRWACVCGGCRGNPVMIVERTPIYDTVVE